jgi:hypothetical protein
VAATEEEIWNVTTMGIANYDKKYGNDYDTHNNPRILIYEFHAVNNPSFYDFVTKGELSAWREAARKSNTTFFAFTIVRNPTSWALSAYHMLCVQQGMCEPSNIDTSKRKHLMSTSNKVDPKSLDDLMRLVKPNPQCAFLYRGGKPYHYSPKWRFEPTKEQCDNIWDEMTTHFDWVGLTEEYDKTIHLLESTMGFEIPMIISNVQTSEDKLKMKDIQNTTAEEWLHSIQTLDEDIYQKVKQHYSIDKWAIPS